MADWLLGCAFALLITGIVAVAGLGLNHAITGYPPLEMMNRLIPGIAAGFVGTSFAVMGVWLLAK